MSRNGFRRVVARNRHASLGMILGGLTVVAVCAAVRYCWPTHRAIAQSPYVAAATSMPAPVAAPPGAPLTAAQARAALPKDPSAAAAIVADAGKRAIPDVVATVNGNPVGKQELAAECRARYGKEVLESMVNKYLILQECRRLGIVVTRHDVQEEIEQMAKSFNLPVEQWMKLLREERGIRPDQYANDIIWPTLALRKLAGDRLRVTQDELVKAFEAEYGPSVVARLIACNTREKAEQVRAMAAANPSEFGTLALQHSEDKASRSVKGVIQPIHKHSPFPEVEEAAFALADGEVSKVIPSAGQFVILKRERLIAARGVALHDVAPRLEKIIRDRKTRLVSAEVFKTMQDHAVVKNVYNDPAFSQRAPGMVAIINDTQISLHQLDEECIARHGADVLDGSINRRLIELACQQQRIQVSDAELDAEVARAASLMVKPLADGKPDVKAWLALVTKRQGISVDVYRRDVVWPSVALRKLIGDAVQVTDEDLKKGFESNYGPRVCCRAIVMSNLRRAQEVWEMARRAVAVKHAGEPSGQELHEATERFGDLAEKYSIEGSSRALRGEVPPIRKFGGQPKLEEEAFSLKAGDLSGIIQLGDSNDQYVILYCIGRTSPVQVTFAEVKNDIHEDIHEKKERMAMAEYFQHLQDAAAVDNFLDPSASRSPARNLGGRPVGQAVPTAYQQPMQK